ncbi:hypothetical protein CCR75_001272 [Bremia lactucae]|uniref:Uncharacterized protein n=1 Tax=Bremia lactucae TaxID=4779 RepID=A0A976IHS2_BRELC|nr:hypothetical protein CCR75_001272 [Bremia lactucae]
MLRAKHIGFKSVRRVEVKAETTTPGELRASTDAAGARVSAPRGRRTLPKLEFTVDEDGAILHGPQRGSFPFQCASSSGSHAAMPTDAPFHAALERDLAASFQTLHMRDFPSPQRFQEDITTELELNQCNEPESRGGGLTSMKECVLNDTRATTLALKYDNTVGKFVCGSSIERFSGHTGVCKVLGSKKYPVNGHGLKLGDLLRIGSVGLVVCELNRTNSIETEEALTHDQYEYLKENYLSLPLQQTFHPTDRALSLEESEDHEKDPDHVGDTSDEGESEEDKDRKAAGIRSGVDEDESTTTRYRQLPLGVAGTTAKRFCYICYDGDEDLDNNPLVAPCHCKGDTKYVHLDCLQRWNNNLDADGTNPNQKVCAVTNTDGLDVCSICKATYLTSVRLDDGRVVSLLAKKLAPPYVTFAVVTQHETRNRSTALTNTRFQLSFANMPRNQPFLTIGRSTTNNMTLRYRTVSQLHAKVKYHDNHFILYDASSSNGTMLFLSKPLELEWGKAMHVKIGRTILTLKAKKKWKWAGSGSGDEEDDEGVSSPRSSAQSGAVGGFDNRLSSLGLATRWNGFDSNYSNTINDPSAELVATPYLGNLPRTYTAPNVLSSRLNRSVPSYAQHTRPSRQRSLSSTGLMLHGDDSVDTGLVTSILHMEPIPFATQEPLASAPFSTRFRDIAATNLSPSLTSQLTVEGTFNADAIISTHIRQEPHIERLGLYGVMTAMPESGATISPTERLMRQE